MMDFEKRQHPWAMDASRSPYPILKDIQCPFITSNSGSWLCCVWRIGHPDSLPHEAYYDQPNGPDHYNWVLPI